MLPSIQKRAFSDKRMILYEWTFYIRGCHIGMSRPVVMCLYIPGAAAQLFTQATHTLWAHVSISWCFAPYAWHITLHITTHMTSCPFHLNCVMSVLVVHWAGARTTELPYLLLEWLIPEIFCMLVFWEWLIEFVIVFERKVPCEVFCIKNLWECWLVSYYICFVCSCYQLVGRLNPLSGGVFMS